MSQSSQWRPPSQPHLTRRELTNYSPGRADARTMRTMIYPTLRVRGAAARLGALAPNLQFDRTRMLLCKKGGYRPSSANAPGCQH